MLKRGISQIFIDQRKYTLSLYTGTKNVYELENQCMLSESAFLVLLLTTSLEVRAHQSRIKLSS